MHVRDIFGFFCARMDKRSRIKTMVFIAVGIVLFLCCAAARLQNVHTNEILRRALSKHLAYG